jgi:hypothetical protein
MRFGEMTNAIDESERLGDLVAKLAPVPGWVLDTNPDIEQFSHRLNVPGMAEEGGEEILPCVTVQKWDDEAVEGALPWEVQIWAQVDLVVYGLTKNLATFEEAIAYARDLETRYLATGFPKETEETLAYDRGGADASKGAKDLFVKMRFLADVAAPE